MSEQKINFLDKLLAIKREFITHLKQHQREIESEFEEIELSTSASAKKQGVVRLRDHAHKLAGTAGTHGYTQLSEAAKAVELIGDELILTDRELTRADRDVIRRLLHTIRALKENANDLTLKKLRDRIRHPDDPSVKLKLLLVEDDEDFARDLIEKLKPFNYDVIAITCLDRLDETLAVHDFSLILMDVIINHDEMAGVKQVKHWREIGRINCPVIFISVKNDILSRLGAFRAGCDGYFVKPFDVHDLVDQIDRLLNRKGRNHYRVLIIDDDPMVAEYNAALFNSLEMNSHVEIDPLRVMRPLKEFQPDVILMDVEMPGCNGFELAGVIRHFPEYLEIPIIFLTIKGGTSRRILSIESGGDEFLEKTVDTDTLVSMVWSRAKRYRELKWLIHRLKHNEERFQQSLNFANVGVWDLTIATGQLLWTERIAPMFGYPIGELDTTYQNFLTAVHPADRAAFAEAVSACITKGDEFNIEHRVVWPDGTIKWLFQRGDVLRDQAGVAQHMLAVVQDISLHKELEEQLHELNETLEKKVIERTAAVIEREERLRAFIDNVPGAVYVCELTTPWRVSFISQAVNEITGWSADDFLSGRMDWGNIVLPADLPLVEEKVHQGITKRQPYKIEYRITHQNGGIHWVYEVGRPVYSVDGTPIRLEGNIFDITERTQGEYERRRLIAILESTPDYVGTADTDRRLLYLNQAARKMIGISRDESIANLQIADMHPHWAYEIIQNELIPTIMEKGVWSGETAILSRTGQEIPVLQVALAHKSPEGEVEYFSTIARDITERKNAERLANRAQRLEAIGTLASGIAHDLNNVLAPIMMGIQILNLRHPDEAEILETFESSARRASEMVRQLLSFAKGAEGKRIALQPTQLMGEMEKIIASTFPKDIELRINLASKLPVVMGDSTQLHQVLLNLCVNARDAMPQGGILTLSAEVVTVDEVFISSAPASPEARPGSYVVLRVTDTGMGITPEILDKVFDPFFTTKEPDKGTGMGLSTVLGIVKGHGGFIRVSSQVKRGTTISVFLPTQQQQKTDLKITRVEAEFHGNGELILFVDDEAPVRAIANKVLCELNFTPLTAIDGADGLIQAAQHHTDLSAIITDFHMPQMDGLVFVHALRRLLPDIPVIIASGRLDDNIETKFKSLGVHLRLDKPFTQQELAAVLRAALSPSQERKP